MFYRYNYDIFNTILISEFNCLQGDINKPVYKKIYWPGDDYTDIHYVDYKEEFEKIQSNAEYNIYKLESINNTTLAFSISKKIKNLIADYTLLIVDRIDHILYIDYG